MSIIINTCDIIPQFCQANTRWQSNIARSYNCNFHNHPCFLNCTYLSPFNSRSAYRYTADVTVYLDPEERGKGYGTELMKELESLAKEQGIRKLVSLVTDGNEASDHLHKALGFKKMTVLKDTGYKFGTWIGVAYYMKDIGGAD